MTLEKVFQSKSDFHWSDIIAPSQTDLSDLAKTYALEATAVEDCLQPEHLPKFEIFRDHAFLIVRIFDDSKAKKADTVQGLTRKIALFFNSRVMLTIHRKDQPALASLRSRWASHSGEDASPSAKCLLDLLDTTISSYKLPLQEAQTLLEQFEASVFGAAGGVRFNIRQGYYLRRQASIMFRILKLTLDMIPKIAAYVQAEPSRFQGLREELEALMFQADQLTENVDNLLALHISLINQKTNEASQRTNEVIRVLTIFSVFLLPLNLVTGIYGMNFEHIPELKWPFGFAYALGLMAAISVVVLIWFRKKGWLKS